MIRVRKREVAEAMKKKPFEKTEKNKDFFKEYSRKVLIKAMYSHLDHNQSSRSPSDDPTPQHFQISRSPQADAHAKTSDHWQSPSPDTMLEVNRQTHNGSFNE